MKQIRTIAVISSSRADYGHLVWPLKAMQAHADLDPRLILMGAQLSPEFGNTADEVRRDGFDVYETLECLLSSDTDTGMAKTIGLATVSLADSLSRLRPDLLLVIADRYEMLAPASVALALRIPIAHIEGGEISHGAIDDAVRNALTKMAHIHFTPHQQAAERVIAMGEEPWRVHVSGAPSLDHLRHGEMMPANEVRKQLGLGDQPVTVVAYHPVTLKKDTTAECDAVFAALEGLSGRIVFCFPNADAGSHQIIRRAERFCAQSAHRQLFVNLPHRTYWGLLATAELMVGNSSSGIMESPSLALPTVDIGLRQQGRLNARNVIRCEADAAAIARAIEQARSAQFRQSLAGMTNPYGDGRAGEQMAEVLAEVALDDRLLIKQS